MTGLPEEPGWYLWHILDLGYLKVGVVQVMEDEEQHLQRLRANPDKMFLLYRNSQGKELTMYHQAHDHLPPVDSSGLPIVDGYAKTTFGHLIGERP